MDVFYWKIGVGLAVVLGIVVAYGALHSIVETKTGYQPFTRQRLTLQSFGAAVYHGALYLSESTGYLASRPWLFLALLAVAAIVAGLVVVHNFRGAGLMWGAVVTAAQALLLIVLGPMFAAMLPLLVFRGMSKNWGCFGPAPLPASPQPKFLYPNNLPY